MDRIDITKVVIYKKVGNGKYKKWKKLDPHLNKKSFSVDTLTTGKTNYFKVRTYLEVDGIKIWSKYSNEVKIKR